MCYTINSSSACLFQTWSIPLPTLSNDCCPRFIQIHIIVQEGIFMNFWKSPRADFFNIVVYKKIYNAVRNGENVEHFFPQVLPTVKLILFQWKSGEEICSSNKKLFLLIEYEHEDYSIKSLIYGFLTSPELIYNWTIFKYFWR